MANDYASKAEAVGATPPAPTLTRHADFNRLWVGQTISMLGSNVATVALPITAVIYLQATAAQVGLLTFMGSVAFLPLSLFAGVLVDRFPRRPALIVSDLSRAAVIGVIPVLALTGGLSMGVLYVCVLVSGIFTVVFDIAYQAYLPSVLPQSLLMGGNSRLELSRQVTSVAAPGIAGAALTVLKAPAVLAADAISYLASALSLLLIRTPEPPLAPVTRPGAKQVFIDIWQGIHAVFANRYIRPVLISATTFNLLSQIILTLFILYAIRDLGLAPFWIGVIFAAGGAGGVVGSVLVNRAVERFGFGPTFVASTVIVRAGLLSVAFVRGPQPALVAGFVAIWFFTLLGLVASNAGAVTVRQIAMPNALRGRMTAAFRTFSFGVIPLGALLAGLLGQAIGVHTTILLAGLLMPFTLLWVIFSPIASMKKATEAAPPSSE
jgi:MFS family permease